ncbi:uncharacterized protein A4U43_C05F20240 [Asparagus officinalis]|uniref:Uncharacterized protein n=1 Tax=Asparagus officinalis TaxID=4686 RepID=A0A5P1EVJ3_ASPOF|nr:uncharacterized protein A4U43_C05F20240 [Asparagus officinalis]
MRTWPISSLPSNALPDHTCSASALSGTWSQTPVREPRAESGTHRGLIAMQGPGRPIVAPRDEKYMEARKNILGVSDPIELKSVVLVVAILRRAALSLCKTRFRIFWWASDSDPDPTSGSPSRASRQMAVAPAEDELARFRSRDLPEDSVGPRG